MAALTIHFFYPVIILKGKIPLAKQILILLPIFIFILFKTLRETSALKKYKYTTPFIKSLYNSKEISACSSGPPGYFIVKRCQHLLWKHSSYIMWITKWKSTAALALTIIIQHIILFKSPSLGMLAPRDCTSGHPTVS